jgi:hypothetical protein
MSLIGRQHVFEDKVLEAHKEWFTHATAAYDRHIEGTTDEWLARVHTELCPRQRIQLLIFVACRYTTYGYNVNPHVTSALFHQVDATYAFLVLVWWLCSQHQYHKNHNVTHGLLPILLQTYFGGGHAAPSQDRYDRLKMDHFYTCMWNHWRRTSTNNGKLLTVLYEENTA